MLKCTTETEAADFMSFLSLFPVPVLNMEAPGKIDIFFTKSVPHILETIFFSLDYESFKTCLHVCNAWRKLLTSERYVKVKKAKSLFPSEIVRDERKLYQAAKEGNIEEVLSLSIFVDVNFVKGLDKSSPVCVAAGNANSKDVIQVLLERGADPDLADCYGRTPLHWAARCGNKDVLRHLLDSGAKPNSLDKAGRTPLHDAAWSGHKDVVLLLLNAGAEPNKATRIGITPLLIAQEKNCIGIVDILNDALKQQ